MTLTQRMLGKISNYLSAKEGWPDRGFLGIQGVAHETVQAQQLQRQECLPRKQVIEALRHSCLKRRVEMNQRGITRFVDWMSKQSLFQPGHLFCCWMIKIEILQVACCEKPPVNGLKGVKANLAGLRVKRDVVKLK